MGPCARKLWLVLAGPQATCYNRPMPIAFDEQSRTKLEAIRKREEEELVSVLSKKYGIGYVNLAVTAINTDALRLIPEETARQAEMVAFQQVSHTITVGVRTLNNPRTQTVIAELENRGYKVVPVMVSTASLESAWGRYKDISFAVETEAGVLDVSNDVIRTLVEKLTSVQATHAAVSEVLDMKKIFRITRTLEVTIAGALANKASDIHIEPEEQLVRIRFRIDGVLVEIVSIDPETYRAVLTRVKLLSGLKINVHDAQDGRFSVRIDTREIEIRTSVLPGNYGESVVLRLLDPSSIRITLDKLGMRAGLRTLIEREIARPNGMILNTGPTGSGKTTTLYAFLTKRLSPEVKIITIEDPVEYHLAGIVQTQVDHKDYTFASGLRSTLRQDPDIIMVGEIRDEEVASTAVNAALTGHLVFSTLHTNNAAGAFPRLIDLGVDPSVIGSSVNVVMAQRLVRKLDPEHRKEVPIEGGDRALIEHILGGIRDRSLVPEKLATMWVPDTDEPGAGYHGRIGVYEAICVTREIEDAVRKNLTIREIEDVARSQDFLSLHEDAILRVLEGVTSLDEVRRVLGEP